MPNPVPKEVTIERERRAWGLRQQGWSHARIGRELGVDDSTVTKMLQRICKRALASLKDRVEEMKAEQTVQLDHIQDEAMQAWERSKKNAETDRAVTKRMGAKPKADDKKPTDRKSPDAEDATSVDRTEWEQPGIYLNASGDETSPEERERLLAATGMNPDRSVMTIIEETKTHEEKGQVGDPRFLAEAQKAMEAKRSIWGIDAAKKNEITGAAGGPIKITEIVVELAANEDKSE